MDELESLIQVALSSKGKSFVQAADCLRRKIVPTKSYPGIMSEMSDQMLNIVIEIMIQFSSMIFQKVQMFQPQHISRAIDALNLASLGLVVKSTRLREYDDLNDAINLISNNIINCKKYSQKDFRSLEAALFNISSFVFKNKIYDYAIMMLNQLLEISNDSNIIQKAHRLKCLCLIALKKTETTEFISSLSRAEKFENLVINWITLVPPQNPKIISKVIANVEDKKPFLPFYALHGDLNVLMNDDDYKSFFPDLKPPNHVQLLQQGLQEMFMKCFHEFENANFNKCAVYSVHLLKNFPTDKIPIQSKLALFFIYYWIVFSYDAIGKPDHGLFYAKEMKKHFDEYPFTVGFALFLELKCKIHLGKLEKLQNPPSLPFDSPCNWNLVPKLFHAVRYCLGGQYECLDMFDEIIFQGNNIIVQREAFNYSIKAYKEYECQFDLSNYYHLCEGTNETKAYYLYYQVIENIKMIDFNQLWSYTNPDTVPKEIIQMLNEAERYARGFDVILRKILQLKALIIGTSDQETTASLIINSLSMMLDHSLCSNSIQKYNSHFPILGVTFINIKEIEPCLLIGGIFPFPFAKTDIRNIHFAIRIEAGNHIENFLDDILSLHAKSRETSPSLGAKEWWNEKKLLDEQLKNLIQEFEDNVLGKWRYIFTYYIYNPKIHPLQAAVLTYLQSLLRKEKKTPKEIHDIENCKNILSEVGMDVTKYKIKNKNDLYKFKTNGKTLPISLILGKYIHQIPWESLPSVIETKISIMRVPSMNLVALRSMKQIPINIDPHLTYYVLNPKGDLVGTEKTFKPIFNKYSWDGVVRNHPNAQTLENELQEKDLFVYCGHGSGNEYFDYLQLFEDHKKVKASMFLMGCSSGKLYDNGETYPTGVPYCCVAAGAGAVVANLWDVTDGEIDRFLISLLKKTIENKECDLDDAIYEARNSCKLRYLTGAAPVIYGFHTLFRTA